MKNDKNIEKTVQTQVKGLVGPGSLPEYRFISLRTTFSIPAAMTCSYSFAAASISEKYLSSSSGIYRQQGSLLQKVRALIREIIAGRISFVKTWGQDIMGRISFVKIWGQDIMGGDLIGKTWGQDVMGRISYVTGGD